MTGGGTRNDCHVTGGETRNDCHVTGGDREWGGKWVV